MATDCLYASIDALHTNYIQIIFVTIIPLELIKR